MSLTDEEWRIVAAYDAREAELGPNKYLAELHEKLGLGKPRPLREIFEEANTLYQAGVCNMIKHPSVTMRCGACGKSWGVCDCGRDVLRAFKCERCGFRVITGWRGLGDLLTADEIVS